MEQSLFIANTIHGIIITYRCFTIIYININQKEISENQVLTIYSGIIP